MPGNLGCYKDHGNPPPLTGTSKTSNKLTIQTCISFCRSQRFKVLALWSTAIEKITIDQSGPPVTKEEEAQEPGAQGRWGWGKSLESLFGLQLSCERLSVVSRDVSDWIENQAKAAAPFLGKVRALPLFQMFSFLPLLFFILNLFPNY